MAIPKSYSNINRKVQDDAFYRPHAAWFLEEMDQIAVGILQGRSTTRLRAEHFAGVLRFTDRVLLDSIVIFDDWGAYGAGVRAVPASAKSPANTLWPSTKALVRRFTIMAHGG